MKEYKIIKPQSMWGDKDSTFEDTFNKYAAQGWHLLTVSFSLEGKIQKAVLERSKNR